MTWNEFARRAGQCDLSNLVDIVHHHMESHGIDPEEEMPVPDPHEPSIWFEIFQSI